MKGRIPIYVYALLAMLFWGLSFIWTSILLHYYEPVTIIFIRLIISSLFLFAVVVATRSFKPLEKKDIPLLILSAVFNPFLYFLLENYGLKNTSPAIAAVIIATIPLFSPFAGYFLVREKVTIPVVLGIVFSFFGIILMLINPDFSLNASPKGVLLLFLAVFAAVAYSVIIRKISHEYNPVTIITHQNLIGAVYFLPLFMVFDFQHFITVTPTSELIMALLQLSVFASTLAYVFYIIAIKGIGVIKANVFANLIPVFTGFFSFIILGETFTALKIAGMLLVLFGVVVSQSGRLAQLMLRNKQSSMLMNRAK